MSAPRFSVVIPTHNRPRLLEAAVCSVLRQTYRDFEIIVVNDGSTSDYSGFIDRWGAQVNYITSSAAEGVSAARNRGVAAACADWILFLDDDDLMAPGYLAVIDYQLRQRSFDFCWCNVKFLFPPPNPGEKFVTQILRLPVTDDTYRSVANVLSIGASFGVAIRKSVFHEANGFDTDFVVGEDTDLFLKLLARDAKPAALEFTGILKNETHGDRLTSGRFSAYSRQRVYELLIDRHKSFLRKHPKNLRDLIWWAYSVHLRNDSPGAALRMLVRCCSAGFIFTGVSAIAMGIYWSLARALYLGYKPLTKK